MKVTRYGLTTAIVYVVIAALVGGVIGGLFAAFISPLAGVVVGGIWAALTFLLLCVCGASGGR